MGRGRLGTALHNNPVRILAEIILAGKSGITQEELSSRLSIERTTVYRITLRLKKKGKIRSNSDGRYTRYTANTNAIQDVVVSSHFQAHWAAFEALKSRRIERISYFADREKLESADPTTTAVFLFSIKTGTLITYLLKEALNPKSQFLSVMMDSENDNLTDEQKYELTLAWLRNCIITILPAILYRFRETIFKVIATKDSLQNQPDAFDRLLQLMKRGPRHIFSDNVCSMVNEAFRETFPHISRDLDRKARRVPQLLDSIYNDGYIERTKPDTGIDAQDRAHAGHKKKHVHEFTLSQLKNDMKYMRCLTCRKEYIEPTVSRIQKADKKHNV